MRNTKRSRKLRLALAVAAGCLPAAAQPPATEPIRPFTFEPTRIYSDLDIEVQHDERSSSTAAVSSTIDRLYIAPTVGAGAKGSVYHPNLLRYEIHAEGGYAWQQISSTSDPGLKISQNESSWLQRYDINIGILETKPYAASFLANKGHSFRDLDLYNRVTVDTQNYGGTAGYRTGPVPFNVTVRHNEEQVTDTDVHNKLDQDSVEFKARNERFDKNSTDLSYSYGLYNRTTGDLYKDTGSYNFLSLNDAELFGKNDRFGLNSGFTYNQTDSSDSPYDSLTLSEDLSVQHTPTLMSVYDYTLSDYSSGPVETLGHFGRASLRHQLYQSLSSVVDVHGDTMNTTAPGGESGLDRYGVGLSESYTKRLTDLHRLNLGDSVRFDKSQQNSPAGVLSILAEHHTFGDETEIELVRPNVIVGSVKLTDPSTKTHPMEGTDYIVRYDKYGLKTVIERVLTSKEILKTTDYVVEYQVLSGGSGSYDTLNNQFYFRVDLFEHLLGLYTRITTIDNLNKGRVANLEDSTVKQFGADLSWHRLGLGAEYENRDSTFVTSDSVNTYERYGFSPTPDSSLTVDLRQRWATFPVTRTQLVHRSLQTYNYVLRYTLRPVYYLDWSVEGGMLMESGTTVDQQLATARTELSLNLRKLRFMVGYRYNNEDLRGEMRERHFGYIQCRRSF